MNYPNVPTFVPTAVIAPVPSSNIVTLNYVTPIDNFEPETGLYIPIFPSTVPHRISGTVIEKCYNILPTEYIPTYAY